MALQSFYSSYGFAYLWLERRFNFNTASWTQQQMCWVQCGSGMLCWNLFARLQCSRTPGIWWVVSWTTRTGVVWTRGSSNSNSSSSSNGSNGNSSSCNSSSCNNNRCKRRYRCSSRCKWQAEQQKLQQQQLQAQWNQQQWAQHLQQSQQSMQQPVMEQPVMQPMQTMQPNQSGAPQQVRFWQNPCGRGTVWFDVDLFSKPARRTRRWTRKFFGCSRRQCMVLSYLTLVITLIKLLCSKCSKLLCQARAETATSPKKPEVGLTSLVERCQHFLV